MTKINSKHFPKKSSELTRPSELAPSGLAQHPCTNEFDLENSFLSFVLEKNLIILAVLFSCLVFMLHSLVHVDVTGGDSFQN